MGVRVVGLARLRKKLAPNITNRAMARIMREASREAEDYAKSRVRNLASVVSGLHSEARATSAKLESLHPASLHIEVGRRPGAPPPPSAALVGWMAKHGITASPWVISRAISRRGIRGRYFMRGAKSRFRTRVRVYLKEAAAGIEREWKS